MWLQHSCFPVNVSKFLRTSISKNICERLLLICRNYERLLNVLPSRLWQKITVLVYLISASIEFYCWLYRVSRPKTFFKKSILENLAKLRKAPVPESLFNKVSPRSPAWNFIKKRLQRRCFPLDFANFLNALIF